MNGPGGPTGAEGSRWGLLPALIDLVERMAGVGYWGRWVIVIQDGRVKVVDTGRTYRREEIFRNK